MKYIKFLDADDIILSDSTKVALELLEKNSNCVLAYGLQRKVDDITDVDVDEIIKNKNVELINNQ